MGWTQWSTEPLSRERRHRLNGGRYGETDTGPSEEGFRSDDLMNLTAGKCVSQAIAVAAELGIADLLKDGPRTAADIARTANASEDGVRL